MLSAYVALELWDVNKDGSGPTHEARKKSWQFCCTKKKQRGTKNATTNMRTQNRPDEYPAVDGNSTKRVVVEEEKEMRAAQSEFLEATWTNLGRYLSPWIRRWRTVELNQAETHTWAPTVYGGWLLARFRTSWYGSKTRNWHSCGKCTNLTSRFVCW